MNTGQSQILSLVQSLLTSIGSAQAFASVNMAPTFAAHAAPHIQADCQALLDAITSSAPLQAAIAKLQQDLIYIPEIAQIV
jgi:hypothetical protein